MIITFSQLAIVVPFLGVLWVILRRRFTHSSLNNIPGPKAQSWLVGDFEEMFGPYSWDFHAKLAEKYGQVIAVNGLAGNKVLYTFDPRAMHSIYVKDQNIFQETETFTESARLVFGYGLLGTVGDQHRKQRKMLNPVFSSAHLRDMTPIFNDVVKKLQNTLKNKLERGSSVQEIDMLSWMSRTALELIGQSGLGFSFDPMEDDESTAHPYSKMIKELFPTAARVRVFQNFILPWASKIGSPAFRGFLMRMSPSKDLRKLHEMTDYMWGVSTEIYESKKRALEKGDKDKVLSDDIGRGKDIISILMKANMKSSAEDRLEEYEVIGQISTLVFAAMDTTSSAMSRMLHLLATHPDIQNKLRHELVSARENCEGELSYDELVALPYLDAVCRETLRLHPPVPMTMRDAVQDVIVPLHTPITGIDGSKIHEIFVKRGTRVLVPIINSNRNVALWGPDAAEWKPERWLSPLPEAVTAAHLPGVYSHLMTFIGGGRSCIGFKFSQLEMKVVMSALISTFEFSPSDKESKLSWQWSIVTSPVIGSDKHPRLPLKVSLAQ